MSVSDHYQQNESLSLSNTDIKGTFRQAQIDFEEERKEHKLENNKLLETIEQLQEVKTEQKNHMQTRKDTATEGRGTIETVNGNVS